MSTHVLGEETAVKPIDGIIAGILVFAVTVVALLAALSSWTHRLIFLVVLIVSYFVVLSGVWIVRRGLALLTKRPQ